MQERRKTKRRYLLYYVRVYNADSRQLIGNLVDITPIGVMIISDDPIPEQTCLRLRIELSGDISEKQFMDISVRSIWSHPDIDPTLYNIGFSIQDVSVEDAQIIRKIIEKYGFRDNKRETLEP